MRDLIVPKRGNGFRGRSFSGLGLPRETFRPVYMRRLVRRVRGQFESPAWAEPAQHRAKTRICSRSPSSSASSSLASRVPGHRPRRSCATRLVPRVRAYQYSVYRLHCRTKLCPPARARPPRIPDDTNYSINSSINVYLKFLQKKK